MAHPTCEDTAAVSRIGVQLCCVSRWSAAFGPKILAGVDLCASVVIFCRMFCNIFLFSHKGRDAGHGQPVVEIRRQGLFLPRHPVSHVSRGGGRHDDDWKVRGDVSSLLRLQGMQTSQGACVHVSCTGSNQHWGNDDVCMSAQILFVTN